MTMLTLAMLVGCAFPPQQDEDNNRGGAAPKGQAQATASDVQDWAFELGSPNARQRDEAEKKLRQAGPAALPALRRAARSPNAERSLRARELLLELSAKRDAEGIPTHSGEPAPRTTIIYDDWVRGIHFAMMPDGKVELTVPERNSQGAREFKSYRADSIEDFKKTYPKIAEEYDLKKFLTAREVSPRDRDWSEEMREWMGLWGDDHWPFFSTFYYPRFESLPDDQEPEADGQSHNGGAPRKSSVEMGRKRFGVLVAPVGPALAAQLGLKEGEGFLAREVEPESIAEKTGVKPYDILLKLNNHPIGEGTYETFHQDLEKDLSSGDFTIEILRGGKRQTLTVNPGAKPQEKPKEKSERK